MPGGCCGKVQFPATGGCPALGPDWGCPVNRVGTHSRGEARAARREADAALFSSFRQCLPQRSAVRFLDRHHMGSPFEPAELAEIRRFCSCWQARGHEFRDRRLERLRRALLRRGRDYLKAVDELTEVGPDGLRTVPHVWHDEDPTRFDAAAYRLNKLADRVVRSYRRLREAATSRLPLGDAG